MTDTGAPAPATVEDARQRVEQTRAELTETLEIVTDKLDVKKQAKAKLRDVGQSIPPPVRHGIDATAQTVRPAVNSALSTARSRRGPTLLAVAAVVLLLVAIRRWHRS